MIGRERNRPNWSLRRLMITYASAVRSLVGARSGKMTPRRGADEMWLAIVDPSGYALPFLMIAGIGSASAEARPPTSQSPVPVDRSLRHHDKDIAPEV